MITLCQVTKIRISYSILMSSVTNEEHICAHALNGWHRCMHDFIWWWRLVIRVSLILNCIQVIALPHLVNCFLLMKGSSHSSRARRLEWRESQLANSWDKTAFQTGDRGPSCADREARGSFQHPRCAQSPHEHRLCCSNANEVWEVRNMYNDNDHTLDCKRL